MSNRNSIEQDSELINNWLQILDRSSYYELLGILEIADESAIQSAFHEFSQSFHPDKHRDKGPDLRSKVIRIYQRGAEAYRVLKEPASRAAYDLGLAQGSLRSGFLKRSSTVKQGSQSLQSLCDTAAGRLHARQTERALSESDLAKARRLFQSTQLAEGEKEVLRERFEILCNIASFQAHQK